MGSAARIGWIDRGDGSLWAPCDVCGQNGIVAIVPDATGHFSITAIVQIDTSNDSTVDHAKLEAEAWMEHVRACTAVAA